MLSNLHFFSPASKQPVATSSMIHPCEANHCYSFGDCKSHCFQRVLKGSKIRLLRCTNVKFGHCFKFQVCWKFEEDVLNYARTHLRATVSAWGVPEAKKAAIRKGKIQRQSSPWPVRASMFIACSNEKRCWPCTKTHQSRFIVVTQSDHGRKGKWWHLYHTQCTKNEQIFRRDVNKKIRPLLKASQQFPFGF